MKENDQHGLQKVDPRQVEKFLPIDLSGLPEEQRQQLMLKIAENRIELQADAQRRLMKSKNAESDLAMMTEKIQELDHERKVYSVHEKLETGAGSIDVKIRGGDTKFIVPILVVIGCIIIGIVLLLFSN
jgi:molybdopterin-biosynthesis enzyme MoeA-like protein